LPSLKAGVKEIAVELGELGLDAVLNDGVLKEIPGGHHGELPTRN
jgi:hypothetical protein